MAEAKSRSAWSHTSSILCLIANVNRDPKRRGPYKPADFNPHVVKREKPIVKVKMSEVKDLLMGWAKPTVTFTPRKD